VGEIGGFETQDVQQRRFRKFFRLSGLGTKKLFAELGASTRQTPDRPPVTAQGLTADQLSYAR